MSDGTKIRLPIWLIVSLMVNALLIGLLIGGGFGQRQAGPAPIAGVGSEQAMIRGIDQAVPADQRQAVRRTFRRAYADSRTERVRVRDARQALGRLLSAEPYDSEAVQAAFQELREADSAMKQRMHDVLAEQFGALSQDQRRAIMRDLNQRDARRGARDRPPPQRPFRERNPD